jgi:hypothetical protein
MRKLECISTDNLNYEGESLEFRYNGHVIFRQINRPLNRGGKTLVLRDVTCLEDIISSGRHVVGENWFKKIKKSLEELNYTIEIEDIQNAISKQRMINVKNYKQQLELENRDIKSELNKIEKQAIHLRKILKDNTININRYANKAL